jgi:2-oxoglutarate dehydrogenase E2 component (dihydrolipoamide succinyltransferase)
MIVPLKVPEIGESITTVEIGVWHKAIGDAVKRDEGVVEIESEKATVEVPAPAAGVLVSIRKKTGDAAAPGDLIGEIDTEAVAQARPAAVASRPQAAHVAAPTAQPLPAAQPLAVPQPKPAPALAQPGSRQERLVRMTMMRRTIAARLLEAQQSAALLTTFNEIDMSEVMAVRREFGDAFRERHGIKLGLMSFFVKAAVAAIEEIPAANAAIRDQDIVFHDYCDIGVAIGSGTGLVVPVLRNSERMKFAEIERAIADFAARAKAGTLTMEELEGGTFTISNGGIYGSLLSTPIVNPPQSAILGLHVIQDRPVAREGQVVIRPMMNVALTYDHRLIDGREAVTFLKSVKSRVEHPAALAIEA